MKLLVLLFTLFLLVGCSTEQENTTAPDTSVEVSKEDDEFDGVSEAELDSAEVIEELEDYPETTTIQETIDLTNLTGYVISDNPGTRILIFTNGDKQVYKSIFVKDEDRVKVVDMEQNDLVIDETVSAS